MRESLTCVDEFAKAEDLMEAMFIGPSPWSLWYQRLHQRGQADGETSEPCLPLSAQILQSQRAFRRQMKQCSNLASPPLQRKQSS